MARASHPPNGKDTPEALLTERGADRRELGQRIFNYMAAESRLRALELRAERDSVQPGEAFQQIDVDGHIVELQVKRDHPDVYTYRLVTLDRDAMLRLLAEGAA